MTLYGTVIYGTPCGDYVRISALFKFSKRHSSGLKPSAVGGTRELSVVFVWLTDSANSKEIWIESR